MYEIEKTLLPYTNTIPRNALHDGTRYGFFEFSPFANTWRNEKMLLNHGEVYLTVWNYDKNADKFYNVNAWGSTVEKNSPSNIAI